MEAASSPDNIEKALLVLQNKEQVAPAGFSAMQEVTDALRLYRDAQQRIRDTKDVVGRPLVWKRCGVQKSSSRVIVPRHHTIR